MVLYISKNFWPPAVSWLNILFFLLVFSLFFASVNRIASMLNEQEGAAYRSQHLLVI